jgi:hypothetical protein
MTIARAATVVAVAALGSTAHLEVRAQESSSLIATIGVEDGAPEYTLGLIAGVAISKHGEIVVLDAGWSQVRMYDQSGRHLRSFGGSGEGPGEFRFPTSLQVSDDHVRVFDRPLRRITTFTLKGELVSTEQMDAVSVDFLIPLRFDHKLGGQVSSINTMPEMVSLARQPRSTIVREAANLRSLTDQFIALYHTSQRVDTIIRYDHGAIFRYVEEGVGLAHAFLGEGASWAVSGDSIIGVVDAYQGHVRIFDVTEEGLAVVKNGRVPIRPRELTPGEWATADAAGGGKSHSSRRVLHLDGPRYLPQLGGAAFDDSGTLWIRRSEPEIFADSVPSRWVYLGIPRGSQPQSVLSLPYGFVLKAVHGDVVVGIRVKELGVQTIEVRRIRSE